MTSLRNLLTAKIDIPPTLLLRLGIIAASLAALGLVSLMIYIPFVPQASGETRGEAVMQRGGCVAALLPISLAAVGAASGITLFNRSRLSLGWLIVGNLPAAVLFLATLGALLWGVLG